MEKIEWYNEAERIINNDLQAFYETFYGSDKRLVKIGKGFRVNPCPYCGHIDSCTIVKNSVHCFSGSCEWKGTHISAFIKYNQDKNKKNELESLNKIAKFIKIPFPIGTKEDQEKFEKETKLQKIKSVAEVVYHKQLMKCDRKFEFEGKLFTPLQYMLEIRKRKTETLEKFSVGFCSDYLELHSELISMGYTKEEIKEAKVWIPEGIFVFWYHDPITSYISRFNTKNPFKMKFGNEGEVIKGFSAGNKTMYFSPDFDFNKKYAVIVEGEHDLFSLYEQGETNVAASGGTLEIEHQLSIFYKLGDNSVIYEMCDNDAAGDKYTEIINETLADIEVRSIKYDETFKDPDEYYKCCANAKDIETLKSEALYLSTDKYKIRRVGKVWIIATRNSKLEYTVKNKKSNGSFSGTANFYSKGKLIERQDDVQLVSCKAVMKPLNFYLLDRMEQYFNSDIDKKPMEELIAIYTLSSKKEEIIHQIAQKLYDENSNDDLVNNIKVNAKKHIPNDSDNVVDLIFQELNDIKNKVSKVDVSTVPKMRVGQFFNVSNNDAYMYFTYVKVDGEVKRKLPYLLKNDGTLIRLDLLKRKDTQCMLLVDNKYELPVEINDAILDLNECSLTQEWVEKFIDNKLTDDDLEPAILVRELERYIRKFYYAESDCVYKVLALYIYMTYFYELFGQVPYLYLNGQKGSGKTVLDDVIKLFSFNAKMALDITEAALFRILSIEGGVLIMDEREDLTAKNSRTTEGGMAAVLKGGYVRSGSVYRANTEKGTVDKYTVYGPKIISNINGMDDVIEDRCITITSYPLKLTKETKLEDPKYYAEEKLKEIKTVTSKCALSALKHFRTLYNIYRDSLFETESARLSQILTPVLAIAQLVDTKEVNEHIKNGAGKAYKGEYEKALIEYWNTKLKASKENTQKNTPEDIIKRSISTIAKELYGLVPYDQIEFTNPANHKYTEAIRFNKEEGWFEVNIVHFKCFIEEIKPGETVYARYIPRWVSTVFNFKDKDIKRRITTIENENLAKEMNNNVKPKVNYYRFYFRDFINLDDEFMKPSDDSAKEDTPKLF